MQTPNAPSQSRPVRPERTSEAGIWQILALESRHRSHWPKSRQRTRRARWHEAPEDGVRSSLSSPFAADHHGAGLAAPAAVAAAREGDESPPHLASHNYAQTAEQRRLGDRFVQDNNGMPTNARQFRVARGHDDGDALLMQPSIRRSARSPPRKLKSTSAASGGCSQTRRCASAEVATGPLTSAPSAFSRLAIAIPSCHESSTTRIRKPLKSKDSGSEGSLDRSLMPSKKRHAWVLSSFCLSVMSVLLLSVSAT